jgi:hypothetical protein
MDTSYGGRRARSSRGGAEDPRDNEREAREYRDGTWRRNCREREVRVWRISREARSKKTLQRLRNLRQTQVVERVIRRSRIFVQPPTDTGSSILYNLHLRDKKRLHPLACDGHTALLYWSP